MNQHLIDRLVEEWVHLDPVDPLRGLISDVIAEINKQPAQQEPVAWCVLEPWLSGKFEAQDCFSDVALDANVGWVPLYTTPPAAPVQEPYGYVWFTKHMEHRFTRMKPHPDMGAMNIKPIYTAPPNVATPLAAPVQEPVSWGVDWGKAGDIPCVSIIKRLPDGGIEVLAVEYAPYTFKEKNT